MESYSQQTLTALDEQQVETARQFYVKALRHDDDETLYNLAEELVGVGFLNWARRIYENLLKKYPDEDDLRTALADIAVSDGKTDLALTYLQQIKSDSSAYAQSLLAQADVYQSLGLFEVAEQKLNEGERLFPTEPLMTFAAGELAFSQGDYATAAKKYAQLLGANYPEVAGIQIAARLGASAAQSGDFDAAIEAYETVTPEALSTDDQLQLGVLYLQTGALEQALTTLGNLQQQDPTYTSVYVPLATAQEKNNELKKALQTIQEGLSQDEYNETLSETGSRLAFKLNDEATGEKMLRQALKIDPDNMSNLVALSNLFVKQHRHQENLDLLKQADQAGEVDPQIYWNLGVSNQALEHLDAAKANYLLAYPIFKQQPDFLRQLIMLFQEMGAQPELKAALKQYLQFVPDDFEMQELLDETNRDQ